MVKINFDAGNYVYDTEVNPQLEIIEFDKFYEAESYHENYYELNKTQPYRNDLRVKNIFSQKPALQNN